MNVSWCKIGVCNIEGEKNQRVKKSKGKKIKGGFKIKSYIYHRMDVDYHAIICKCQMASMNTISSPVYCMHFILPGGYVYTIRRSRCNYMDR